jgi:hypothetical protein
MLEKDLERRQESYIVREKAYQEKINFLERDISQYRSKRQEWMNVDDKVTKFRDMQDQIIKNVESVQDRANRILKDQERDLVRSFQARLFCLQAELEKEKVKSDDGSVEWIDRCKKLECELEWAKEVCSRVEGTNKVLLKENARLKSQYTMQEEDREFLVKQVSAARKENARLKTELSESAAEIERFHREVI